MDMNILFSNIVFLFLAATSSSQQFSFIQLVEMTNDKKVFEINMIKELNQMHKKENKIGYVFSTNDGTDGASSKFPTNNPKYEPKFLFDNGIIYTDTEIENQKLDDSYEIRNRLRKEGNLLNIASVDSFYFCKGKLTSLIKSEETIIGFAENYDPERHTATTWYTWERHYYKILLPQSKLFNPNYKKLTVQYASDDEFSKILKEIIESSKYLETKEEYGSFISKYNYYNYLISTERFENYKGGLISIYIEK
jgi:hypothetical protein